MIRLSLANRKYFFRCDPCGPRLLHKPSFLQLLSNWKIQIGFLPLWGHPSERIWGVPRTRFVNFGSTRSCFELGFYTSTADIHLVSLHEVLSYNAAACRYQASIWVYYHTLVRNRLPQQPGFILMPKILELYNRSWTKICRRSHLRAYYKSQHAWKRVTPDARRLHRTPTIKEYLHVLGAGSGCRSGGGAVFCQYKTKMGWDNRFLFHFSWDIDMASLIMSTFCAPMIPWWIYCGGGRWPW